MFQDGSIKAITPASEPKRGSSVPGGCIAPRAITHPEGATFPMPLSNHSNRCWPGHDGVHRAERKADPPQATDFNRFPFNNFTYCLTLFSKFFSSFPHGTCSLSVSRQYLALDGIYHPFRAAFPNNSTLRKRITRTKLRSQTGFSPSMMPCSKGLIPVPHGKRFSRLQLGP